MTLNKTLALGALLSATALWPTMVDARAFSPLQTFVAQHVYYVSGALNNAEDRAIESLSPAAESAWGLTNFYLRIQAQVGFDIPLTVNLSVVPEAELVWHKMHP